MTSEGFVPCFACGNELRLVSENSPTQCYNGVPCVTYGGYGSRVYDPNGFTGTERMVFAICDECLKENGTRVLIATEVRPREKTLEYAPWSEKVWRDDV